MLSPQSPLTPNGGPPSKRRKLSTAQSPLIQSPLPSTPTTDAQTFHAAVEAEDAKRAATIERIAAQAGETKWVLSTADGVGKPSSGEKKLQFLTAGYSDIDQDIETMGRRTFGRYRSDDRQQAGTTRRDTDSLSEEDEDDGDDDDNIRTDSEDDDGGTVARSIGPPGNQIVIRADDNTQTSRKWKNAKTAEANNEKMRKEQEVKLNGLTSISGGGGGRSGGGGLAGIECHFCGEKGHRKAKCPKKARLERRRDDR
ncbi:hypothetical protein XANCAGTX0491_009409 [Xanthoria calcicola]